MPCSISASGNASHPPPNPRILIWIMTQDRLFFKFTAQLSDRKLLTNQVSVKEGAGGRKQTVAAGMPSGLFVEFAVSVWSTTRLICTSMSTCSCSHWLLKHIANPILKIISCSCGCFATACQSANVELRPGACPAQHGAQHCPETNNAVMFLFENSLRRLRKRICHLIRWFK